MHCHDIEESMFLGEERWLTYKVISCSDNQQDFTIQDAIYEIPKFLESGDGLFGNCIINEDDKTVRVKVKPVKTGSFALLFTLLIADETIKLKGKLQICE